MSGWLKRLFKPALTETAEPPRPTLAVRWNLPPRQLHGDRASNNLGKRQLRMPYAPEQDELAQIKLMPDSSALERRHCPLTLINTSTDAIYNIKVQDVVTNAGSLRFPGITFLASGESVEINGIYKRRDITENLNYPETTENFFLHQAYLRSDEEWRTTDGLVTELEVDYETWYGRIYLTLALLSYNPDTGAGQLKRLRFPKTEPTARRG